MRGIEPSRINSFELWQSEEALDSWRSVVNPPEKITPVLESDMQKYIIDKSGPGSARYAQQGRRSPALIAKVMRRIGRRYG